MPVLLVSRPQRLEHLKVFSQSQKIDSHYLAIEQINHKSNQPKP